LKAHAPFAYPNGVEPEQRLEGHSAWTFDGEMTREAFKRLDKATGTQTIPLRVQDAFDDVVEAHRRMEQGHVIGKLVLRI